MKKAKILIIGTVVAICAAIIVVFLALPRRFQLSSEFYNSASLVEASTPDIDSLVEQQKSFLVFVSQPDCRTADELRKLTEYLIAEYSLQVFETTFMELKESALAGNVRFFPSFLIVKNGELVDFLKADDDADAAAYTTYNGLVDWLSHYVDLRG